MAKEQTDKALPQERVFKESKIQHSCVNWFRRNFPDLDILLYAVPNGGKQTSTAAFMHTYEGRVSGVPDLILAVPSNGYGHLGIEMKVPKRKGSSAGKQSEAQKEWQRRSEQAGNKYVVCHCLAEFIEAVCDYLGMPSEERVAKAIVEFYTYL